MRPVIIAGLLLCGCLSCFTSYGQQPSDTDIKIDPRQYVTVQYKKTPTLGKLDTIWNWENRTNIPSQKYTIIDIDGEIKISFDKIGLISNMDFEGTVSLEAEISGLNGTRRIEVNPYSEIGVQRIPIGIRSEPPSEIAKKLLNMILEVKDADSIFGFIQYYSTLRAEDIERNAEVALQAKHIDSLFTSPGQTVANMIDHVIAFKKLVQRQIDSYYFDSERLRSDTPILEARTLNELRARFNGLNSNYKEQFKNDKENFVATFREAYSYAAKQTDIILEYLASFENSGEDAIKAYLSLINKDLVNYRALKNSVVEADKKLSAFSVNHNNQDSLTMLLLLHKGEIIQTMKDLASFSRFKGSAFENILMGIASARGEKYDKTGNKYLDERAERNFYFNLIQTYLTNISEQLSVAAGRIIYKKLVYATIDLGRSGAKNDEVLNIYITWILDSKRDSLANSPRLPIGKYYLRETGWKFQVTDMFSLIKRLKETDAEQAKVSPSNFKGAGGAVLMWTFNKQDKGLKITAENTGEWKVRKRNRFINFLEPSIGFNVSYLDFSTDKDVEIGTGLQFGLFRNKVFFGYGVNLHMLSPRHQQPNYFYLGFSFARLSDIFKNSTSLSSIQ